MDFSIWFLVGAALVFFMQGGFAMVETGFTRAKNAGNIIMKNLMDFCIGTVFFVFIGYSLMLSENHTGFIGIPNFDLFAKFNDYGFAAGFVFNLVFAATAATIVSGSMAERTKFSAYCIYSAVISAVVYPIEAGWVWNGGGWLANMGYIDFAGSSAIHMVGGITAFIGAAILGPRIGKYNKDKSSNAIPGHSITLGALGCFILWFGWYGFNGAAATDINQMASIFLTTTVAPAAATCVTMIFTWIKNGKPDVSMTLNGSLAGLVAITAGCATVDVVGSLIIGLVAGILVVVAVEVIDMKLHVDDPVGAVAVHGVNGIWGTLAVGLFATDTVPLNDANGLFYGGGAGLLGVQALGILAIAAWTTVTMLIVFLIIKKVNGLRVKPAEEISGLDMPEHGLPSAYADFMPISSGGVLLASSATDESIDSDAPKEKAVPSGVTKEGAKITKVTIIFNPVHLDSLKKAMNEIGITGMTVTQVMGCGIQKGRVNYYRGVKVENVDLLPKLQMDIVVTEVPVENVVSTAQKVLHTGNIGDGKIFTYDTEDVIKISTGERGYAALQGVDDI
ncbi:MAG: ammonium transporter [Lachnospiraceae bacterium]|nr:ammonium transporter [Lachnospiraceae bacterium]